MVKNGRRRYLQKFLGFFHKKNTQNAALPIYIYIDVGQSEEGIVLTDQNIDLEGVL